MLPKLYHSLADLGPIWDEAVAGAAAGDVFASRSWFENLAETCLDPGEEPLILAAERPGGEPAALLPCRAAGRRGRSLTNFYTCSFRPILAPGVDRDLAFAALARAARLAGLATLDLDSLPADEPGFEALRSALRAAGFLVVPYFHFINRYDVVAGRSAAAHLALRPAQLRNTLRRKWKALEREGRLSFELHREAASADEAVRAYEAVYAASWKGAEPYPDFTPSLIRRAAAAGALRLGVARLDGAPAAAQLWLVAGGGATIFKLAYDERFRKQSVGTILTAWMFERTLDGETISTVDFGRNDDPYKRDWLPQRRERWGLLALDPRRPAGLAGAIRHMALAPLARRLRRRAEAAD
jgi:CelD/BcsL family acetyltransferase involved in cellulose biosynthesis